MAERRMFAKKITTSARFLRMPLSSRLLWYDLGMMADDDGFVEAFSVLKLDGCTEDDLRVLVSKGFVKVMNDDLVSLLTDWKTNNTIRKDRYTPSVYLNVFEAGIPSDNHWLPDGKPRLGKDRVGKVSVGKDIEPPVVSNDTTAPKGARAFVPPTVEEVSDYCAERNNTVDPQTFVDFYTSKGWVVGKTKMKDWKAAVRTWERKRDGSRSEPQSTSNPFLRLLQEGAFDDDD